MFHSIVQLLVNLLHLDPRVVECDVLEVVGELLDGVQVLGVGAEGLAAGGAELVNELLLIVVEDHHDAPCREEDAEEDEGEEGEEAHRTLILRPRRAAPAQREQDAEAPGQNGKDDQI